MKRSHIFSLIMLLLSAASIQSQPFFELIAGQDLSVVGITPVNIDRWGVSVADIDGNGWPDVFETKWRGAQHSQIYMNTNGIFEEISEQSPQLNDAEAAEAWTRTPSLADYDNDGDKDLFWGSNDNMFLFRNDNNVFVDVTSEAGLQAIKPPGLISWWGIEMGAWADYDLDGDLDLLVSQTNNPDFYFYRNNGDGTFTNIAADVGLTGVVPLGAHLDQGYWYGRVQWVDFDYDGDPDFSSGINLFRNDDGVFTEVSEQLGLNAVGPEARFTHWFDYDNDSDLDFFKAVDVISSGSPNELWAYENGQFFDVSSNTAINVSMPLAGSQASINLGDFDNDGDQDIFVPVNSADNPSTFLLNDVGDSGGNVFVDVASLAGIEATGDRKGGATIDYDMDGFLDNFVASAEKGVYLYHNLAVNTENHWVGFILEGTQSNRDAVGTFVTLVSGETRQLRHTTAPASWKLQDNPYIHFGLGTKTTVDSVIIRWPLGMEQVLTDVEIDQYHKVVEPEATTVTERNNTFPDRFVLGQNYPNPFNAGTVIEFRTPEASQLLLTVYNLQGQKVVTLLNETRNAGIHQVRWNGYDQNGQQVPSGVYFYKLSAGQFVSIRKALFLK